ncbi:MAG TPA: NAD+ synthase [Ignavibacteria bacterium]|nr:NAD+ synthase [Ignavibacteria bacterium]
MKLNNKYVEQILTGFLYDETHRIGMSKAVIGLSGGIDSAVSAVLAARAFGPENVHCILMPHKVSSKESITHAELLVDQLGVHSEIVDITSMTDAYTGTNGDLSLLRKGNVMARMRMIVLYDKSAELNALVIGTSNKTELLLGYSTIFGDSASAINPIGDLYKTQLRDLARHLDIPQEIINKKPSADLWAGQTDEGELGFTYEEVDQYLFQKVDERRSEDELRKMGFDEKFMTRIDNLIKRNQFKRLPPLIAKLSARTINIDFRYNRDWNT